MKRYCYIPTGNKLWVDLAVRLRKENIATPVIWIGDDRHYEYAKSKFSEGIFKKNDLVFYPENLKNINYEGQNSIFFISDSYIKLKDKSLKMMDRLDLYNSFSRLDREVLFNKLCMWCLQEIHKTNPDCLIASEKPHSYTQYILYEICIYLNIRVLRFNTWNIIPVLSLKEEGRDKGYKLNTSELSVLVNKFEKDIKEYIALISNKKTRAKYKLNYIRRQEIENQISNRVIKFVRYDIFQILKEIIFQTKKNISNKYYPINSMKFGFLIRTKIKYLRYKNIISEYLKYFDVVDLNSKFVYFPLHFEPERSTNPDGGNFHDQIIAIINLRGWLPQEIKIYVKEHPSHFLNRDKGSRGRSPLLYDAIKSIKNVYIVSRNVPTFELIEKSLFVASITGTASLEAAIVGKLGLIFGDAWFSSCPNIVTWSLDLNFVDLLSKKILSQNEIEAFLIQEMKTHTVPGFINMSAEIRHKEYNDSEFNYIELNFVFDYLKYYLVYE